MGIVQVQNHLPAFEFAGESSRDYGVYITDVNVFDGAARDIKLVDIPGRNGAYIIDNGRFDEITLVYDCAMGADGTDGAADFAENMAAIRAWLSSVSGYARLEDDINPDEYRMAAFSGGIKVDTNGKRTGEFSIEFTARPERFLKSGETAVTVTSGDTITNPTAFESRPLIQVWGHGDIEIGGGIVNVQDSPIGSIAIGGGGEDMSPIVIETNSSQLENGDTITINRVAFMTIVGAPSGKRFNGDYAFTTNPYFTQQGELSAGGYWNVYFTFAPQTFVKGTASNKNTSFTATYGLNDGTDNTVQYSVTYSYDGESTFTFSVTITPQATQYKSATCTWSEILGDSTQSSLGNPAYIDLEIGEAYKVESGKIVSINRYVQLPALLPGLLPGANTVTFDNTFTNVKVTPRWWTI